ncbi:MAG: ATP-binding cassette domain-containing protein [Chthonomonas sp.]|nr:ATP-binding cassette domain-containing protein [Chthonomonas sp.]
MEFKGVSVEYGKYVRALTDVSFSVQKGEFVFFVGRTGSGKSTVLKLLSREVQATRGTVMFDGTNVSAMAESEVPALRRRMGIVPQDFGLLPRKKAWENIGYAMRAVGKRRSEVRKAIEPILENVNLAHRADAFPTEMSGGEQQRLAIARALINSPQLILADEPTGNLDAAHSLEIIQLLQDLNRQGATVLVATHDLMVLEQFKQHRVVTLDGGKIVSDGVPSA